MGSFYSVRGWLEGDDDHVDQIKRIIAQNVDRNPYTESWCFQDRGGGFSRFVFFGCTVRDASLPKVQAQILRIAETVSSRDGPDVDFIEGTFHVGAEDDAVRVSWECRGGQFRETAVPPSAA